MCGARLLTWHLATHTCSAPDSWVPPPPPCTPVPEEGVLHPEEVGERWKGEETVGVVPIPLSVRFMTVELKYASSISRGSSLSSIRACTLMLLERMRVDPPDTGTEGDSSALPDSERNPYSPSFLYGSGYWGGSVSNEDKAVMR